jgi:acyl carrier protein
VTKPDSAQIKALVGAALDDLNQMLPDENQVPNDPSAPLIGRGARIDSMGLVSLIVAIEEGLLDEYDIALTLVDDRAMSQERSPFRTLGTLTEFVEEAVRSQGGG